MYSIYDILDIFARSNKAAISGFYSVSRGLVLSETALATTMPGGKFEGANLIWLLTQRDEMTFTKKLTMEGLITKDLLIATPLSPDLQNQDSIYNMIAGRREYSEIIEMLLKQQKLTIKDIINSLTKMGNPALELVHDYRYDLLEKAIKKGYITGEQLTSRDGYTIEIILTQSKWRVYELVRQLPSVSAWIKMLAQKNYGYFIKLIWRDIKKSDNMSQIIKLWRPAYPEHTNKFINENQLLIIHRLYETNATVQEFEKQYRNIFTVNMRLEIFSAIFYLQKKEFNDFKRVLNNSSTNAKRLLFNQDIWTFQDVYLLKLYQQDYDYLTALYETLDCFGKDFKRTNFLYNIQLAVNRNCARKIVELILAEPYLSYLNATSITKTILSIESDQPINSKNCQIFFKFLSTYFVDRPHVLDIFKACYMLFGRKPAAELLINEIIRKYPRSLAKMIFEWKCDVYAEYMQQIIEKTGNIGLLMGIKKPQHHYERSFLTLRYFYVLNILFLHSKDAEDYIKKAELVYGSWFQRTIEFNDELEISSKLKTASINGHLSVDKLWEILRHMSTERIRNCKASTLKKLLPKEQVVDLTPMSQCALNSKLRIDDKKRCQQLFQLIAVTHHKPKKAFLICNAIFSKKYLHPVIGDTLSTINKVDFEKTIRIMFAGDYSTYQSFCNYLIYNSKNTRPIQHYIEAIKEFKEDLIKFLLHKSHFLLWLEHNCKTMEEFYDLAKTLGLSSLFSETSLIDKYHINLLVMAVKAKNIYEYYRVVENLSPSSVQYFLKKSYVQDQTTTITHDVFRKLQYLLIEKQYSKTLALKMITTLLGRLNFLTEGRFAKSIPITRLFFTIDWQTTSDLLDSLHSYSPRSLKQLSRKLILKTFGEQPPIQPNNIQDTAKLFFTTLYRLKGFRFAFELCKKILPNEYITGEGFDVTASKPIGMLIFLIAKKISFDNYKPIIQDIIYSIAKPSLNQKEQCFEILLKNSEDINITVEISVLLFGHIETGILLSKKFGASSTISSRITELILLAKLETLATKSDKKGGIGANIPAYFNTLQNSALINLHNYQDHLLAQLDLLQFITHPSFSPTITNHPNISLFFNRNITSYRHRINASLSDQPGSAKDSSPQKPDVL